MTQITAGLEPVSSASEAELRDTERIMTLITISSALEQYYQDNVEYPRSKKELYTAISTYSNLKSELNDPLFGKK